MFKRSTLLAALLLVAPFSSNAFAAEPAAVETRIVNGNGGVPIAVMEWGNKQGPGVILIHGFLASNLNWEKQIKSDLGKDFHMVAIDMRGHGASGKPWNAEAYVTTMPWADDIAAVMKATGLNKPVIVAWSYGGFFAMDYIRHYGADQISGLMLAGTIAGLLPPAPKGELTPERKEQIRRNTSPNLFTISDWTDGFMQFVTQSGSLDPKHQEMFKISAMLTPHYIRDFLRERPSDNSDIIGKITVPVLFAVGSADVTAKVEDARKAAATMPNATVDVYEGMGNLPFWYAPERFDASLTAFVKKVSEK